MSMSTRLERLLVNRYQPLELGLALSGQSRNLHSALWHVSI